jgi:hypothetical protein
MASQASPMWDSGGDYGVFLLLNNLRLCLWALCLCMNDYRPRMAVATSASSSLGQQMVAATHISSFSRCFLEYRT